MRHALTRLELNGFKSFANKTVLEFPPGITAVVGPNGSGKSNIIDAIRWLLGERDAKNLRGGKGEDLIFAGSEKRPRMSSAQATLYFDSASLHPDRGSNSKEDGRKLLSSNVSEISVMRQVNRDGASQYFLNKSEVRLKDLIDFFAQARLGAKGLTVITQGSSDIFIRVSPAERRAMIEEILGLREYQIKKTDAERRLKNADINLEKANALAEEILPHLRSLKRQTSRWEKRGVLEDELREFENHFFGSRFHNIKNRLEEINILIKNHEKDFEKLEKDKLIAEKVMKDLEENHPSERKELESVRREVQKFLDEQAPYQNEIGKLQGQIELLKKRGETAIAPPPHMLLELAQRIKRDLESHLEENFEELKDAVKKIIHEISKVLSAPPREEAEEVGIKTGLAELLTKSKELEHGIHELRKKEQELEKGQEQFYQKFKDVAHAAGLAKEKIDRWHAANRDRTLEKERLEMKLEELTHQIAQAGRHIQEFEKINITTSHESPDVIEKKIFRLRGELASMGEADEVVMKEARETEERYTFLIKEVEDLKRAEEDLKKLIANLNLKIKSDFEGAFSKINDEFQKFFELMFGGGKAKLRLEKRERVIASSESGELVSDDVAEEKEEGIEISVSLPRKRINSLEMLSGGERSLVGIAALFAMISVSPPPFLVLDEVDAPLDEKNARRFGEMLQEFSKKTQFVVVTHNRATMEAADVLYGVTLNDDGTSKILSMKFE